MKVRSGIRHFGFLAAALLLSAESHSSIIAVQWAQPVLNIDPSTGVAAEIAGSSEQRLNSLAQDSTGTLYANVGQAGLLATVDPVTGVVSTGPSIPDVRGLAFSAADTLYGIQNSLVGTNDGLITIDTTSGAVNVVGLTGLTALQGLAFSAAEVLYGWDLIVGLVTIDTTTGVATDVDASVNGFNLQSLLFSPDGTLYGASGSLYTVDASTGAGTLVGGSYDDVRGIEWVGPSEVPVPVPATLGLLGLGLAGLGFKRRK